MPQAETPNRQALSENPLNALWWGVERETHRLLVDGRLSPARHPETLRGPSFTKDFAESQLEIVTAPHATLTETLAELARLTATASRAIGSELLWPFSIPPRLPDAADIPIADLGSDESARRARLYREGLALRYGGARQMTCGVHVNVSLGAALASYLSSAAPLTDEERRGGRDSDGYALRLTRHLYADLPVFILMYGASPALGGSHGDAPPAISYRNSPLGYARDEFLPYLDLESLEGYLAGIRRGLRTESPAFSQLGLVRAGRVVQLNTRVFQTEKEFYAPIRLRQTALAGESALDALARRGVAYLELRFFDIDPTQPIGIAEESLRLLHLFLIDNLMRPSAPRPNAVLREDLRAAAGVALGHPLRLTAHTIRAQATRRLEALAPWARRLDGSAARASYGASLALFQRRLGHPATLPSAALFRTFADSGLDWTSFGVRLAQAFAAKRQGAGHALDYARV